MGNFFLWEYSDFVVSFVSAVFFFDFLLLPNDNTDFNLESRELFPEITDSFEFFVLVVFLVEVSAFVVFFPDSSIVGRFCVVCLVLLDFLVDMIVHQKFYKNNTNIQFKFIKDFCKKAFEKW